MRTSNHLEYRVKGIEVKLLNHRQRFSNETIRIEIKILVEYDRGKQFPELSRQINPYSQYNEEELFELGRS